MVETASPARASITAVVILVSFFSLARAGETVRCEECEHRYLPSVHESMARPRKKHCRVCRVQIADTIRLRHEMARTAAEREEQQAAWDALRTGLRRDDYEIFELDDERVPVLLPLETRAALVQALGDEALRFRRSATWSKRMAGLYRTRRGTGLQVFGRGDRWGRWAYDDLILAFEERAALFAAMAKGYAALAKEPSSPVLEGALPHVTSPAGPEGDFSGNRAAVIATELRRALRDLLRLERKGLDRLRARTRGEEGAPTLSIVDRKAMRDLYPDAFSTAIVANLHDRSAKQVRGVSVLRSRLYEDAPLDGAFARARLIASALRRESNVVAPR